MVQPWVVEVRLIPIPDLKTSFTILTKSYSIKDLDYNERGVSPQESGGKKKKEEEEMRGKEEEEKIFSSLIDIW
ncbi:MAG: hypothetical protein F6K48_00060 [Okeania sp. SIO3H1]|nr:hypothetical protein [Okeania sp. SIO3H1]